MKNKFLLIVLFSFFILPLRAGVIEYSNYLDKSKIDAGKTIYVKDPFFDGFGYYQTYTFKASLKYGRKDLADLASATPWSYQVNYTVRFYDNNGTLQATSSGNSLTIFNNATPVTFEAVKVFDQSAYDYPRAQLTVDSYTCTSCSGVSDIQLELSVSKNKTGSGPLITSGFSNLGYNNTTQTVYWSFLPGAESYELEWVYIDSLDVTGTFMNPDGPFNFKEPTKISTKNQHFQFSNTYPSGKVYFRVRGVGTFPNSIVPNYGTWSYGDDSGHAVIQISKTDFEYDKNWQYTTTYAEDGKYKKVLSYYDGSLRSRQSLVNISTDTTVIASEIKYDYEGRGVVNVMPVPLATNSLKYNVNLNRFTKDSISAYDNRLESFPLDSASGAARYYSYNNPFTNSIHRDFIPNAEGYPYSQVIYTNDNTGRIAKQTGVGKVFHFNSADTTSRKTQYFYGSPSDTELKKLFGANVGNTSHYKKNMIVDPNGQISVQILDQEGRIVATSLGGNTPANLRALASNVQINGEDTISLNKSNKIDATNFVSRSVTKIMNMVPSQNYRFNYDLTGVVNNTGLDIGGAQICKTCKYDLKVTVIDPDGQTASTFNQTLNPPTVSCGTVSYAVSKPTIINIPFTKVGDYTVIKELTLSSGAIDTLLTSVRSSTSYPNYNTILADYLSKIDISMCNLTCEDNCTSEVLKSHLDWTWENNATEINAEVALCVSSTCGEIIDREADNVSKNDCESSKEQMLLQLSPGGYYNAMPNWLETNVTGVVFHNADGTNRASQPTITELKDGNVFESQWAKDLLSKHPEYGHLTECYSDIASKNYDKNLSRVTTWASASTSGYLNPLWMTSGEGYTFGTTSVNDPFFSSGRGVSQRGALVTKMQSYSGSNSIWDHAINMASNNHTITPVDYDKAWSIFQGLYMAEKQSSADAASTYPWLPTGASYTIFQKPVAPPEDEMTMNSINYSQLQSACRDNCDENVIVWMNMLKSKCDLTWAGTDSLEVAESLKTYCLERCGFDNPFALLLAEDISVNSTLQSVSSLLQTNYGCSLESIATVDPCAHRTQKSTTVYEVSKKTLIYYDLINEILAKLTANCSIPGSNCLSQNLDIPIYVNQFNTYNNNKSYFDNVTSEGALEYLRIHPFGSQNGFLLWFHFVNTPANTWPTIYHFWELENNGIYNYNSIKRVTNIRVNPNSISEIMFDFELLNGTSISYPLVSWTDNNMDHLISGNTVSNQTQTFYICDSIDASNSTFTYVLNTQARRDSCIAEQKRIATSLANAAYQEAIQKYENEFLQQHFNKCFNSPFAENFYYISKQPPQYHYTLYYYDQAGNLVQTVPPEGVDTLVTKTNFNKGTQVTSVNPAHRLVTKYKYNSLNQLIWQITPDGGTTNFYYNEKGQLRLSQNSKQKGDNSYSYTKYDETGRIIEVGLMKGAFVATHDSAYFYNPSNSGTVMAWLNDFLFPSSSASDYTLSQKTNTVYDISYASPIAQNNIRNRVSFTYSDDGISGSTYYSYDIHGNVNKLAQTIPGLGTKIIEYEYDLISGNVKTVSYQKGAVDAFYHKYQYDADNRIVSVKTSSDGVIWSQDATYNYYKHGPLARTELGEYKVQGLDYYYTLQGWLKGINTPQYQTSSATSSGTHYINTLDPGKDGTSGASLNKYVAQDEFQMALGYYQGDYKGVGSNANLGSASSANTANLNSAVLGYTDKKGLYNGNISWMVTDMRSMYSKSMGGTNNALSTRAMSYQYDQLNRLVGGYSYNNATATSNAITARTAGRNAYDFRADYDANGNINWLSRAGTSTTLIDSLNYNYNKSGAHLTNNKLRNITDQAGKVGTDIGTQSTDNYDYDEIGNLIKDNAEEISKITWNIYGKVQKVERTTGSTKDELEFQYDATGNRVVKIVKPRTGGVLSASKKWSYTYYVRDASGNVMATYTRTYNDPSNEHFYTLGENGIFGSARVGIRTPNLILKKANADNGTVTYNASLPATLGRFFDKKSYELTDHLGNVRVSISDLPKGYDNNSDGKADYYFAGLSSFTDYGPFGESLPGRKYVSTNYPYGFNGKEKDDEGMGGGGSTYDYGFRIYNPNIGKFLSVDPLTMGYPMLTPYQYASNTPIAAIDLDGLEAVPAPLPLSPGPMPLAPPPPVPGTVPSNNPNTPKPEHVLEGGYWGVFGEPFRGLVIYYTPEWTKTYDIKPFGAPRLGPSNNVKTLGDPQKRIEELTAIPFGRLSLEEKNELISLTGTGYMVGPYKNMPTPRLGSEAHHGIMSAYLEKIFPKKYNANEAPTVLMSFLEHKITTMVYADWLKEKTIEFGGKFDWRKVSIEDMKKLSDKMFEKAGIPQEVVDEYYRQFEKYYETLIK